MFYIYYLYIIQVKRPAVAQAFRPEVLLIAGYALAGA